MSSLKNQSTTTEKNRRDIANNYIKVLNIVKRQSTQIGSRPELTGAFHGKKTHG